MMQRRIQRGVALGLAVLLLPSLSGCYEYAPLESAKAAPVGEIIELQVSDQGRVGLSDRFGPGLASIEGRLVSQQSNEFIVNIFRVKQINGESTQWAGESARLDRGYIATVKGRQFSSTRTLLVAAGAVIGLGLIIANRGLLGSFSGPTEDPPSTEPPAQRLRIPVFR